MICLITGPLSYMSLMTNDRVKNQIFCDISKQLQFNNSRLIHKNPVVQNENLLSL